MSLTLYKSTTPALINGGLAHLRDEMDRVFGDPWAGLNILEPKAFRTEGWFPPMDVSQTDKEVTIRAELPGIAAEELEIAISGNTLTISGDKLEQQDKRYNNCYHHECRYGYFRRLIELPEGVDPDKVTAESDNGIVTIHVAKAPGAKTRKVEVKPASKAVRVTG